MKHENVEILLSKDLIRQVDLVVKTGCYKSKADFVKDAINALFTARPDIRKTIAAHMYQDGEISIGKACEMADTDIESFKTFLASRGIWRCSDSTLSEIRRMAKVCLSTGR